MECHYDECHYAGRGAVQIDKMTYFFEQKCFYRIGIGLLMLMCVDQMSISYHLAKRHRAM
jgi:hypothetical protein